MWRHDGPAEMRPVGETEFANGIADDFLTSLHLVTRAPILMAPAMNSNMWAHIAVVRNLAILREGGVRFVEPETGELACGWTGPGRLAEPDRIVEAVEEAMRPAGSLIGRCILITAGPTYEDLDPVRYLGNRSTGRMGLALAREAARRGARVIFISGPIGLDLPQGIEIVKVRSASDMHSAVMAQKAEADAMILAAAVADYTPMDGPRSEKMSKFEETLALTFVRTPDILGDLGRWRGGREKPVLVGFAAETEEVVARARAKLSSKQADLIVANDVSRPDAGFAVETNAVTLVTAESETEVPLQAKREVARVILDRVGLLLTTRATVNAG